MIALAKARMSNRCKHFSSRSAISRWFRLSKIVDEVSISQQKITADLRLVQAELLVPEEVLKDWIV